MENAPTPLITPPPPPPPQPFPFSAPPRAVGQITVIAGTPPSPPQQPFPDSSSSVDLSPLEFLLALVAVVTIPALIYTFIFAVKCPSRRRRHPDEISGGASSVVSEAASHDGGDPAPAVVSDLKYRKDAHVKEIGSECPVCLSVFGDGEEVRQLRVCKHSFHASCIDMWLSNHSNCPICRATIAVKRPNTAAPARNNDDLQQGLPDASALV